MFIHFSGFGQQEGTHHFRITSLILPEEKLYQKLQDFREFNEEFHKNEWFSASF